jgi:hypothetical protein
MTRIDLSITVAQLLDRHPRLCGFYRSANVLHRVLDRALSYD